MFLKQFVFVIILVFVRGVIKPNRLLPTRTIELDYAEVAVEAEKYKDDILNFLNLSRIQEQYKYNYNNLLTKLTENKSDSQNRRDNHPVIDENDLFSSQVSQSSNTILLGSYRRIVAGKNTSIAAVPWQVSLREKSYPICGGSVITGLWIVTAAHCLLRAKSSDLSVRLGSSWKTHGGEMYDVELCFVHPKYYSKTKVNDVGLVKLYTPLRFSARVLPIRIVARNTKILSYETAIVSGWGRLKEGGPAATFLQSSTLPTIPMKLCKRSALDVKAIHPSSMFCAGYFNHFTPDACQGDSGGPIVRDGELIGVVSWGLGCSRGNFPGVYTRLANPLIWDWIHSQITINNSNDTVV